MPRTARVHFEEDISRAKELVRTATHLPSRAARTKKVHDDVLRSAWMFGVGAADAYFCDAYADLIASSFICKDTQRDIELGAKIDAMEFPVSTYFSSYEVRDNWKWRMAARAMIERDNILTLEKVRSVINPFMSDGHKLFAQQLHSWVLDRESKYRVFGITNNDYRVMNQRDQQEARKLAKKHMESRFKMIFQRRHDCIHNCDRPKQNLQPIRSSGTVDNVLGDIEFLVLKTDDAITNGFRAFLRNRGFSGATRARVNY